MVKGKDIYDLRKREYQLIVAVIRQHAAHTTRYGVT